ncbi:MAG TPA: FGGY-family carbohydrate kinase [Trebonia sp.]|nr:FGGY-family carbohydrate kinase [Trebonia sp.]
MALMGVDVGTSATKGLVMSEEGLQLALARRAYSVTFPADGRAEIDPTIVWAAVRDVMAELAARTRDRGDMIRAIALSVSGNEATPVDAAGRPLYQTIMGTDSRSDGIARWWEHNVGRQPVYEITGIPVHSMHPLVRLMWLRDEKPEIYARVDKMLCWEELFAGWMGAEAATDFSLASCTMAFDIGRRRWSPRMLETAGIRPGIFPRAVPSGTPLGRVSRTLAAELGLTVRPVVVAGGFDQPMAALGAGQTRPGDAGVGTGSWEALVLVVDKPRLTAEMLEAGYPFGCYVADDLCYTAANNPGGGSIVQWFRDNLGETEVRQAALTGRDAFDLIVSQATDSPTDLVFLPHFEGSYNPWMNPWSRGNLFGLTLSTTKGDIIKAILEGITYELRENLRRLEAAGLHIGELTATGGGAKSDTWLQLKSDMTGKLVKTVNIAETGCFAAACTAGVGVGTYASVTEPIRNLVMIQRAFEPRAAHYGFYDEGANHYRMLCETLGPLSLGRFRPGRA